MWTKIDLPSLPDRVSIGFPVSVRTGQGIAQLLNEIASRLATGAAELPVVAATADRCVESLRQCRDCLEQARTANLVAAGDELVAFELRGALNALGKIVGVVATDDLLDRIFSRFCIGK